MPDVLVPHDDGRWWPATPVAQYRSTLQPGRWKVTVRYSVQPGAQYQRTLWADDCRAVDNPPPGGLIRARMEVRRPLTSPRSAS